MAALTVAELAVKSVVMMAELSVYETAAVLVG